MPAMQLKYLQVGSERGARPARACSTHAAAGGLRAGPCIVTGPTAHKRSGAAGCWEACAGRQAEAAGAAPALEAAGDGTAGTSPKWGGKAPEQHRACDADTEVCGVGRLSFLRTGPQAPSPFGPSA